MCVHASKWEVRNEDRPFDHLIMCIVMVHANGWGPSSIFEDVDMGVSDHSAYPLQWQSKNAEDDVIFDITFRNQWIQRKLPSGNQTWQWNNPQFIPVSSSFSQFSSGIFPTKPPQLQGKLQVGKRPSTGSKK